MRKGVLVEETYRIFSCWDLSASLRQNLTRIREQNPIGASNAAWLREVFATLSSRFSAGDSIAPLVILAKAEITISTWKYCLLWKESDDTCHLPDYCLQDTSHAATNISV